MREATSIVCSTYALGVAARSLRSPDVSDFPNPNESGPHELMDAKSAWLSSAVRALTSVLYSATSLIPPWGPRSLYMGTPAEESASTSRNIVRVDTSNSLDSCPVVMEPRPLRSHMMESNLSARI